MSGPAGLVLAAGAGSRLGRPKALLVIEGERLVDRAVRTLRAGGCTRVHVVTGAVDVPDCDAAVVPNPAWCTGLGSSLRAGLAALPADAGAVVVTLVDTPSVRPEVVERLVSAWDAGHDVVVASYCGQPRTPVLLGRRHWHQAAELATGDRGARAFLAAHPELVRHVECGDLGPWHDIDTPADLP